MTPDWSPLRAELAMWRAEARSLPVWWRDDDTIAPTPALEQLTALSTSLSLPVHLAVIPKPSSEALTTYVAAHPNLLPLVHGWQHQSHAPEGAKNAEFGHPRPDAVPEARAALARMGQLFGPRLLPVFVPPWNRLAPALLPELAAMGFCGVSTYLPRTQRFAATDLVQINTHIDPIHWRGGRGLVPPEALIAQIVTLLQDRRAGRTDAAEPLGFLTHHLVHDGDIWAFTQRCLATLLEGGATPTDLRRSLP